MIKGLMMCMVGATFIILCGFAFVAWWGFCFGTLIIWVLLLIFAPSLFLLPLPIGAYGVFVLKQGIEAIRDSDKIFTYRSKRNIAIMKIENRKKLEKAKARLHLRNEE